MNCYEILSSIVIPIISAIIGGGLTLIGVLLTIRFEKKNSKRELEIHEREKDKEARLRIEPLFYIIDPMQKYDYKNVVEFDFASDEPNNGRIQIIFKNTDKIQIILDYISFNDRVFYPINGTVVDKNVVFYINVYGKKDFILNNKDNDIYLAIKDILNNSYKYRLVYSSEKKKFVTGIMEKEN